MDIKDILAKCDHTLLAQGATWADIKAVCDDGMKYGTCTIDKDGNTSYTPKSMNMSESEH